MASIRTIVTSWFGWGGRALGHAAGAQNAAPVGSLVEDTSTLTADTALQLATVWACVDRRAKVVASLPFFVYETDAKGRRTLARGDRLYQLLHESPNARMTPYEFWMAMMLNHDLRGNAYARIERADPMPGQTLGEAVALWPMPADQTKPVLLDDGSMVYEYRIGNDVAVLSEANVLHLKDLGNGTVGLPRLEYMRATTTEAARAQSHATKTFANGGKPSGVLMTDSVLKPEQREKVRERFAEMASGPMARLFVLEAQFKYQQLTMSPEDIQLLDSRRYSTEEICRWFDVPPVLVHHSNVTTWGSAIEQIVDGWHKVSVGPLLVSINQAVRKRVMTPKQRSRLTAELNHDALLRASLKDRVEIYAKQVQNGLKTRDEVRQLENDEPLPGGGVLTVQSNLLPISMLGRQTGAGNAASSQNTVAQ